MMRITMKSVVLTQMIVLALTVTIAQADEHADHGKRKGHEKHHRERGHDDRHRYKERHDEDRYEHHQDRDRYGYDDRDKKYDRYRQRYYDELYGMERRRYYDPRDAIRAPVDAVIDNTVNKIHRSIDEMRYRAIDGVDSAVRRR